jgi:tRNA uridine 5-carbamoylmethylation protein Kti12
MKTLIVMSSVPGAGKSTWCRRYKSLHENCHIISSDAIREELTGTLNDFSKQKEVWETFEQRIHEYANLGDDITVILDALCDLNTLRIKYANLATEYDKKVLVCIYKDLETIQKYNKERRQEQWVPDDVLIQLYNKYEPLTEEARNCYDEVIEINGYFS